MKKFTYSKFLFILSGIITAVLFGYIYYSAIKIYLPFSFIGFVTYEEKFKLMQNSALPVVVSSLCFLLMAYEQPKLKRSTLGVISACSAIPAAGMLMLRFFSVSSSSYQVPALIFYLIPLSFTLVLLNLIPALPPESKKTRKAIAALMAVLGISVVISASVALLFMLSGSVLLLAVIMYLPLPLALICDAIVLLNRIETVLSKTTVLLTQACSLSLFLGVFFLVYKTEITIYICGISFTVLTLAAAVSAAINIRRYIKSWKTQIKLSPDSDSTTSR